jgi:hypothetical protein
MRANDKRDIEKRMMNTKKFLMLIDSTYVDAPNLMILSSRVVIAV